MKLILVFILALITFVLWFFATSTKIEVDGKRHIEFYIKSMCYWIAVILSFSIGIYVG